jgi:hypothetical protein
VNLVEVFGLLNVIMVNNLQGRSFQEGGFDGMQMQKGAWQIFVCEKCRTPKESGMVFLKS